MKPALYRGQCTDNKKWVIGFYHEVTKGAYLNPIENASVITTFKKAKNGEIILTGAYEVIPETVGEYSGINDKSNKKIFESDIIEIFDINRIAICKVVFRKGFFVADEMNRPVIQLGIGVFKKNCIKIIGNVYDNPELLSK